MTGKPFAPISSALALLLFSSSLLNAQDYSLSHLTNDATLASLSTDHLTPKPVEVGKLPAGYLGKPSVEVAPPSEEVTAVFAGANLAVLIGFAGMLAVGGTITSLCVFARRKPRHAAPVNMVSA